MSKYTEALNEITKYQVELEYTMQGTDKWRNAMWTCKEALEIADREQWIPVSERLPIFEPQEKRRSVLVTIEDRSGKRFVSKARYSKKIGWYDFTETRFCDDKLFKVIAWREKPKPYR